MKTVFEVALTIAEGIASRKSAELTALSYNPLFNGSWVAYFGNDKGTSHVEIEGDTYFDRHLEDYEENFSAAGSPAREVLENDGEHLLVEVGRDLVIVTRRNLGPYDNSEAGCQVDVLSGDEKRDIYHVDEGTALHAGHATIRTYRPEDFEEV